MPVDDFSNLETSTKEFTTKQDTWTALHDFETSTNQWMSGAAGWSWTHPLPPVPPYTPLHSLIYPTTPSTHRAFSALTLRRR